MASCSVESIIAIDYVNNHEHDDDVFEGYVITTTKQQIYTLISSGRSCCEDFGCAFLKPHDTSIIDAEVLSVKWGRHYDESLEVVNADKLMCPLNNSHKNAVVEILTSVGMVQLVAFNEHNGYYPHNVYASWNGYEDVQEI